MKERSSRKIYIAIAGISLFFAAIACGPPPKTSDMTPTVDPAMVTPTPLSGIGAPTLEGGAVAEAATATSTTAPPTLTPTTACTYDSVYISDITIPDDTEIVAGAAFTKTWRIQNNGCLPWPDGTVLLFAEGEQMGGPISVPVPGTAVGGTQDISVPLTAPVSPGEHKGYWQLRSSDGVQFGDKIYVKIISVAPTPMPTLTPTATLHILMPVITLQFAIIPNFEASYAGSWMCQLSNRTTIMVKNTGTATFESMEYRLEGPPGTVLKTGSTNAPFRSSATGSGLTCSTTKGANTLDVNVTNYLWLGGAASPGTHGKATVKMCSQDDMQGLCKEISISFTYD